MVVAVSSDVATASSAAPGGTATEIGRYHLNGVHGCAVGVVVKGRAREVVNQSGNRRCASAYNSHFDLASTMPPALPPPAQLR
jgi:hypothetical protein